MRQLTTLTSVQGSRHDIIKFKQNKKLLHSLKGDYEINLPSKLVTRKLITKNKEREKDSLPSRTSRAGVSAPHEREGAWVIRPLLVRPLSSPVCPVPFPSRCRLLAAVHFRPPPIVSLPPHFVTLTLHPESRGSQRREGRVVGCLCHRQ